MFDRSWYNRAGVEHVIGFCTKEEYSRFMHQCPIFERLLVEDGILLRKYWFSVSDEEQQRRFDARLHDPLRSWKLSPMDLESITHWEDDSRAKDEMFVHTDIPEAPWHVVESDDKRRARINMIAHLLSTIPYRQVKQPSLKLPPRPPAQGYIRTPRDMQAYVPDHAAELLAGDGRTARTGLDDGGQLVVGYADLGADAVAVGMPEFVQRAQRLSPGPAGRARVTRAVVDVAEPIERARLVAPVGEFPAQVEGPHGVIPSMSP